MSPAVQYSLEEQVAVASAYLQVPNYPAIEFKDDLKRLAVHVSERHLLLLHEDFLSMELWDAVERFFLLRYCGDRAKALVRYMNTMAILYVLYAGRLEAESHGFISSPGYDAEFAAALLEFAPRDLDREPCQAVQHLISGRQQNDGGRDS